MDIFFLVHFQFSILDNCLMLAVQRDWPKLLHMDHHMVDRLTNGLRPSPNIYFKLIFCDAIYRYHFTKKTYCVPFVVDYVEDVMSCGRVYHLSFFVGLLCHGFRFINSILLFIFYCLLVARYVYVNMFYKHYALLTFFFGGGGVGVIIPRKLSYPRIPLYSIFFRIFEY